MSSGSVCLRVGRSAGAKALLALCNQRLSFRVQLPWCGLVWVYRWVVYGLGCFAVMETCEVSCGLAWAGVLVRNPAGFSCCRLQVGAVPRRGALSLLKPAGSQRGRSVVCCPGQPSV